MATRLNFASLHAARIRAERDQLALLGGKIGETELLTWLKTWKLDAIDLPWRLWESISNLKFEQASLPTSIPLLERGRLFGEDGDLTVRRDGNQFRWWYVGKPSVVPKTILEAKETSAFWQQHPTPTLHTIEQSAILWGSHQGTDQDGKQRWYDDRVGWANLAYPVDVQTLQEHRHIYIRYREYLNAGQVAFVWIHGLGAKGN